MKKICIVFQSSSPKCHLVLLVFCGYKISKIKGKIIKIYNTNSKQEAPAPSEQVERKEETSNKIKGQYIDLQPTHLPNKNKGSGGAEGIPPQHEQVPK